MSGSNSYVPTCIHLYRLSLRQPRSPETAGDVTRPLPLGLLQLRSCRPSRVDTDATSARAERCRPASARS